MRFIFISLIVILVVAIDVTALYEKPQSFSSDDGVRYSWSENVVSAPGAALRRQSTFTTSQFTTSGLPEYGTVGRAQRQSQDLPAFTFRGGLGRYVDNTRVPPNNFGVYSTTAYNGKKPVYTIDRSKFTFGSGLTRTNSIVTLQFMRNPNVGVGYQYRRWNYF